MSSLLIKNASQLATLSSTIKGARKKEEMSELNVIEDGAIYIVDGRIEAVGLSKELVPKYEAEADEVVNATDCLVTPGFSSPANGDNNG